MRTHTYVPQTQSTSHNCKWCVRSFKCGETQLKNEGTDQGGRGVASTSDRVARAEHQSHPHLRDSAHGDYHPASRSTPPINTQDSTHSSRSFLTAHASDRARENARCARQVLSIQRRDVAVRRVGQCVYGDVEHGCAVMTRDLRMRHTEGLGWWSSVCL